MIENTPMVMPVMVNAARNLFAPREDKAILTISLNNMSIYGVMECWTIGLLRPSQFAIPSLHLLHYSYSYLSAVTGSRREADHAGAKPEISPVNTDTSMLTSTSSDEK